MSAATQPESVDQKRNQYTSKSIEIRLDLWMVTLLWNISADMSFNVLKKRGIFLQGCSHLQEAEGNLLQDDTSSQIVRQHRGCETFSLFDGEVSQLHDAEVQQL